MNSREIIYRTIRFEGAERLPRDFPEPYGSDIVWVSMKPSPDDRPREGVDEWGAVWKNLGPTQLGEVKVFPLLDWSSMASLPIPDIETTERWTELLAMRERLGDKFILANGISIYERVHFLRGLENTWTDIHEFPDELCAMIDILVEMNLKAIKHFAEAGADGYIFCDDWGLQERLMISPKSWRKIWKPRYEKIFKAVHEAGMCTFLHSCGYIVDILDDLIEVGLDVINMDQQENMGLDLLGKRFGGRLTFYSPVDIQNTMIYGDMDEIRAYCRAMGQKLGRPEGGFIPKWYSDPVGAGHRQEAIEVMCEEFIKMSSKHAEAYHQTRP